MPVCMIVSCSNGQLLVSTLRKSCCFAIRPVPRVRSNHRVQTRICSSHELKETKDVAVVPWQFGFQCNERYLQWEDAAQEQLVRIYLAQKLDVKPEEVDARLETLANLLPDMVGRLQRTRADLLLRMLADMQGLVAKLLALRELLPACNVSLMVSRYPYLLLDYSVQDVQNTLDNLRQKLPGVAVEEVLEREPLLLRANIDAILDDIRRLLPNTDPVAMLVANPQMVLDMQTGNMPSSEDVVTGSA